MILKILNLRMEGLQELWLLTLIALFIVMVPAADLLLVLKNTMIHGKKAGIFTISGIILALSFGQVNRIRVSHSYFKISLVVSGYSQMVYETSDTSPI